MVPAPRIREVRTARELAEVVACAPRVAACCAAVDAAPQDIGKEYAVWFSPGQVSPMGQWVLRGDGRLNHDALTEATRRLVDRHPALRLQIVDPLRYLSFTFDVGVLFTLIGPLLERGPWLGRLLRRVLARMLEKSWPRVRCFSRREMYAKRNEAQLPLDIIQIHHGQDPLVSERVMFTGMVTFARTGPHPDIHKTMNSLELAAARDALCLSTLFCLDREEFESTLKRRRYNLVPPTQITGYEMVCHLEGTWAYQRWDGQFVIREAPPQLLQADAVLIYVDVSTKDGLMN
eukprot:s1144_g8.t1